MAEDFSQISRIRWKLSPRRFFGVADYESQVKFTKLKMSNLESYKHNLK